MRKGAFLWIGVGAVMVSLLPWLLSGVHAGGAGKDPACVKSCGQELSSCNQGCRPNTRCFNECKAISALLVNQILECQNRCADEIQICQDLCSRYGSNCVDNCPSKP